MPELRFPEFKHEGEWNEKTLGEITKVISKRNSSNKKLPIYSINNKEGFLPQGEQFEGIDSNDRGYDISLYKVIERNTFAYNPARIDVGSIGFSGELQNVIISSLYVCFQASKDVDNKFLWQFFNTFQFNQSVKNNVEGGIRNYLFYENFSRIKISVPCFEEQQKIASCLSSLDELVETHCQKLDLLKYHKKGLMQNLFPREGEKVPKVRFSEFKNDGNWIKETVGDVYDFKVTNSFSREYLNYEVGFVKNIHYGDIHTKFNTLFDIAKEDVPFINPDVSIEKIRKESYCIVGDMIFADASEDMNDVGKSIEIVNLNKENLVSGLHTLLARQKEKKLAIGFGGYLFKSDWVRKQIQREAQGAKVLGISATRISNVQVLYPKNHEEQQKISFCLSSLDELIKAQAEKIEQLKKHKKGLMQGLFPKMID